MAHVLKGGRPLGHKTSARFCTKETQAQFEVLTLLSDAENNMLLSLCIPERFAKKNNNTATISTKSSRNIAPDNIYEFYNVQLLLLKVTTRGKKQLKDEKQYGATHNVFAPCFLRKIQSHLKS